MMGVGVPEVCRAGKLGTRKGEGGRRKEGTSFLLGSQAVVHCGATLSQADGSKLSANALISTMQYLAVWAGTVTCSCLFTAGWVWVAPAAAIVA